MGPFDKKLKKLISNAVRVAPKVSAKGDTTELRDCLASSYPQTRKDAIKKTIQHMTMGKDMSSLFPDVLRNMATSDVEQKKLVYLYVMNYATSHPELCILAVNTFVSDASDPNPLIRCMAIRTMCMIRVDMIIEYVESPLRACLADENPYVRKTAVICVAKLYQLNKELCLNLMENDLIPMIRNEDNAIVLGNALASCMELQSLINYKQVVYDNIMKFLNILNESSEWTRITILTAIADYEAHDESESLKIIDRVVPHLQHVNPSVVLSSVKVVMKNLNFVNNNSKKNGFLEKLATALVSIMSTPFEIQYVALKNIRIILEKYPTILSKEYRIFYLKYNDPLYIKMEKLEILVRVVLPNNLKQCQTVLQELKDYSTTEFNKELVSKVIRCLSQLAIKVPEVIPSVIDFMTTELSMRQDDDDVLIALCSMLRNSTAATTTTTAYKTSIKQIISYAITIYEDRLIKDEGKCNFIWLIGEYPNEFGGNSQLATVLEYYLDSFNEEESMTQMALLLTIFKNKKYLSESLLQTVLQKATQESNQLDIRDMAMMYWRCLSLDTGTNVAENIINDFTQIHVPTTDNTIDKFPPHLLELLLQQLSTLSTIYFRPNNDLVLQGHSNIVRGKGMNELADIARLEISKNNDLLLDFDTDPSTPTTPSTSTPLDDLNDLFGSSKSKPVSNSNTGMTNNGTKDLMDLF